MKKLKRILVLISVTIFLSTLQFCESLVENPQLNNEFENPFNFVGEIHNEGLRYILKEISIKDRDKIELDVLSGKTVDFINVMINNELLKPIDHYKELGVRIVYSEEGSTVKRFELPLFLEGTESELFLNQIKTTFREINPEDIESDFKRLFQIEKNIWYSDINEQEKNVLLIVSSVGKYSFQFWENELFNQEDSYNRKDKDLQEVLIECLEADYEGALLGGIAGIIYGAVEGTVIMPGVGTITAAVLECVRGAAYGAVIGSVWKAFKIYVIE